MEDHPLVRAHLSLLLETSGRMQVAGWATTAAAALTSITKDPPDLVMLDVTLEGKDGLELLKDLRAQNPDIRVLVFSAHAESILADRALRAGALGYVCKTASTEEILRAMDTAIAGQVYLSPSMTAQVLLRATGRPTGPASPIDSLSDRELQVFRMIGQGIETRNIAQQLKLDVKTIETYRARIKEKLGLTSATALQRAAFEWSRTDGQTNLSELTPPPAGA